MNQKPEYRGKNLYEVLFANDVVSKYPLSEIPDDQLNDEARDFGFYIQKGLFEEYASFGRGHAHDLAPFDVYHQVRGLRWPVVDGKETLWRYREGFDPFVPKGEEVRFYGKPDGKAVIFACLMNQQQKARTKNMTSGSLPAGCWNIGTRVQ